MKKIATIIIAIVCVISTFGVTYYVLDAAKTNEINNLTTRYESEINNLSSNTDSLLSDVNTIINLASENFTGSGYSFFINVSNLTNRNAKVTVSSFSEPDMCIGYTYNLTKSTEGWIITSKKLYVIC